MEMTNKGTNLFAFENFLEFAFYPLNRDVGHGYPRVPVRLGPRRRPT